MAFFDKEKKSLKARLYGGADLSYFYIGQIQEIKPQPNNA